MPKVLEIESLSFKYPWKEEDFLKHLRTSGTVGFTLSVDGDIRGYMLYNLQPKRVELVNLVVHPDYRRRGYGRAMIEKLKWKVSTARRKVIMTTVHELNLVSQKFLKSNGFVAVKVLEKHYFNPAIDEDSVGFHHCDGYRFRYVEET